MSLTCRKKATTSKSTAEFPLMAMFEFVYKIAMLYPYSKTALSGPVQFILNREVQIWAQISI